MLKYKLSRKILGALVLAIVVFISFNYLYPKSSSSDFAVSAQNNITGYISKNSNPSAPLQSKIKQNVSQKITLPILMYHHINTVESLPKDDKTGINLRVSPEIFEKQLQFLQKNKFNTINSFQLQDYLNGGFDLPDNPIMLTFDDGFTDSYTNAFPVLKKYNMSGDFGIVTSMVGQSDHMSWDNLNEMKNAGMSFASHTDNHCTTAIKDKNGEFEDSPISNIEKPCSSFAIQEKLSSGQIKYEFEKSKNKLEKNLNIKISHLIYPFGFYNKQAQEIAKNLGYSFATTVKPQKNNIVDFTNPFEVGRFRVQGQQVGDLKGFFVN